MKLDEYPINAEIWLHSRT